MPKRARPEAADQLPRQWALLRLLASQGARGSTVKELSEQLQSSKSNVERDLYALKAAGFPIASEADTAHRQRLRWKLADAALGIPLNFGAAELLSLYAASCMLEFLANTPVHMDLQAALAKVRAALTSSTSRSVQRMAKVFTPHLRDFISYEGEDRRAILDDLMDAIVRQRRCRITYRKADADRAKTYFIHPLRIFGHHNALYAFVQVEPHDEVRTFSVHRIASIDLLDETFDAPHVDLEAHARRAFGVFIEAPVDVEVHFKKPVARYIRERTFHPDEAKEDLPEGGVRYRVRAGGRQEIVAWVLSFAGLATLVSPEEWRVEVANGALSLLDAHETAAPPRRRAR